jgi:hypothetical protein
MVFGILTVVFGVTIFYGLPKALLSRNYSNFLTIIMISLLGLIFGLTLIAYNL